MTPNVLTLAGPLSLEGLDAIAAALEARGGEVVSRAWLAPGGAADLVLAGLDARAAEEAARGLVAGDPVDVAAQPVAGRRKRLLVADLESTVIANEMLDELAELAGKGDEIAEVTARAMRGELDFEAALKLRVAALAGRPEADLETCRARMRIDPGAAVLVATMKAHGATTALVTGGFGVFAEDVRARLGFDLQRSNDLVVDAGVLSGRVREPVLDRAAKLRTLDELCARLGLARADAVAVGDGANDLDLLAAAGLGVAFHAKPRVSSAARFRIDHGDLSTLLFFQGYPEGTWVGL